LEIEYFTPDQSEEEFIDLEVYNMNDEEVKQQYYKDDTSNNIIRNAIRWKMKQLDTLKHLPYFDLEEERKKRVRLKHERIRNIDEFEQLIFNLSNSTEDISKSIAIWKGKRDANTHFLEGKDSYEQDLQVNDWNLDTYKKPSTEVEPKSPVKGLSFKQCRGEAEGKALESYLSHNSHQKFIYTKTTIICAIHIILVINLFGISISICRLRRILNPCRHEKHGARFDQKTSLLDVYFLLSNGRIFLPNPLNPDMSFPGGKRGSYSFSWLNLILHPRSRTSLRLH
jgi:hypothetical protein